MERNLAPDRSDDRPARGTQQQTDDPPFDQLVFDCSDYTTVAEAVVDAVATTISADPLDMDPLYSQIDLDALERIVGPKLNGQRRGGRVTVEFRVVNHDVVVTSDGIVSVSERVE